MNVEQIDDKTLRVTHGGSVRDIIVRVDEYDDLYTSVELAHHLKQGGK